MKLIKLNESQYKRLFETSDTVLNLADGDERQDRIPPDSKEEITTGTMGSKPFGGITRDPDGKLIGKNLNQFISRPSTFNMGGVRGGTGGF